MGRMQWAAAMAVMAVVSVGGAAPVQAGPFPESFNQLYESVPITVNGSYTPLVGELNCTLEGGQAAVIWYAPGGSADWIWADLEFGGGEVRYSSRPLSVEGNFEPFVGDFDADGCDDVFWYAPGSGVDFVWYGVVGGGFTSRSVTVNGDYMPLVGGWGSPGIGSDIYWYGSGGGTESIWGGTAERGTFVVSTAPQVTGTDFLAVASDDGALFYRPGPGADYLWEGILAGATAPGVSIQTTITRAYEPFFSDRGIFLYGPGTVADKLLIDYDEDGSLTTIPGTINGSYRVGKPFSLELIVFHAPGSAQDYLWAAIR